MTPREVAALLPDPIPGHEACESAWECLSCGRPVCPRCDPSPGEFKVCAECHWFGGAA